MTKKELEKLIIDKVSDYNHGIFLYIDGLPLISNYYKYELMKDLFSQFPDLNNKKFLEVGCNIGMQSFLLKKIFPNIKLTSVEREKESFDIAQLINKYLDTDINFINIDVSDLDVSNFDYIFESRIAGDVKNFFNTFTHLYSTASDNANFLLLYPETNKKFNIKSKAKQQYENIFKTINLLEDYQLIDRKIILTKVSNIRRVIKNYGII